MHSNTQGEIAHTGDGAAQTPLGPPIPPAGTETAITHAATAINGESGLSSKPVLQHLGLIFTPQLHMRVNDLPLSPGEWILNTIIPLVHSFLLAHTDRNKHSDIN